MKVGTIIIGCVCMYLASIRLAKAKSATTVRDYRLELHNNQVSHNEAKTDCESRGAWLVEIKDKEIDDAVETLVPTDAIWIGLSYDGEWRWSDGSSIHYEYWRKDAEFTLNEENHDRCVNRGGDRLWSNIHCNSSLKYICQSDTTYPGSFNLTVKEQKMNFQQANANCQADGATLIDIKTMELNSFAVRTVSDKIGRYWTGGNNIGHTGTYRWGDGIVISDNNPGWYKGRWDEPNNKNESNHCVVIFIADSWKGWADVPCSAQGYPICQKNATCDNSICSNHGSCEIVGTRYKCSCDSDYFGTKCESDRIFFASGNCKYHVNSDQRLKFPNANDTCQALHGSLVMIKSLSLQDRLEDQIIKQYGNKGGNIEFWLGGYRSNGTWLWMDGTKIPSTGPNQNWERNQKQYMILSAYKTTRDNMKWYSKNDEEGSRGFICEVAVDDPCKAVSCGRHGTCVSTGCQANCRCNPGYFGHVCQNDLPTTTITGEHSNKTIGSSWANTTLQDEVPKRQDCSSSTTTFVFIVVIVILVVALIGGFIYHRNFARKFQRPEQVEMPQRTIPPHEISPNSKNVSFSIETNENKCEVVTNLSESAPLPMPCPAESLTYENVGIDKERAFAEYEVLKHVEAENPYEICDQNG